MRENCPLNSASFDFMNFPPILIERTFKGDRMINSVDNNGLNAALNGLNRSMQNLNKQAGRVAQGNPDAEKITKLMLAQQNAKIQAENVKTMVDTTNQILDILV